MTHTGATHTSFVLLGGAGTLSRRSAVLLSFSPEMIRGEAEVLGARVRVRIITATQLIPTDSGAGLVQKARLVSAPVAYAGYHAAADYATVGYSGVGGAASYSDYTPTLASLASGTYLTFILNTVGLAALVAAQDAGEAFTCAIMMQGNEGGIGPTYFDKQDTLELGSMDHGTVDYRPQLQLCAGVFYRGHGAAAASTSVTLPAGWQAGDLALVQAANLSSGLNIDTTLFPAGWTSLGQLRGHWVMAWRLLEAGDTSTGTWLGADKVQVTVYGGVDPADPLGKLGFAYAAGTGVLTPLQVTDGTSWVHYAGLSETDATYKAKTPASFTNRSSSHAVGELEASDTDGGVATQGSISPLAGGGNQYQMAVELVAGCPAEASDDATAQAGDGRWGQAWAESQPGSGLGIELMVDLTTMPEA